MTPPASLELLMEYGVMLIKDGQPDAARKFFEKVVERDPRQVNAWLLLAGVCDRGEDSLRCLVRALEIEPRNDRAHAGIRWARKRVQPYIQADGDLATRPVSARTLDQTPPAPPKIDRAAPSDSSGGKGSHPAASILLGGLIGLILIACLGVGAIWLFGPPRNANAQNVPIVIASATATLPPTSTATSIPIATSTPTLAPTEIVAPAPTIAPTEGPTEVPTALPLPTNAPTVEPAIDPAPSSTNTTRWIDVDLTNQVLVAYEGDTPVRTTLVSTGLPGTPTVTGQFNIYVKYPAQLMYGPGYYLPDVPWVMYFYNDYGLHGTYWHNNFGHPMSHGCVNLPTPEAEWLYNWASIGTLVNIHY